MHRHALEKNGRSHRIFTLPEKLPVHGLTDQAHRGCKILVFGRQGSSCCDPPVGGSEIAWRDPLDAGGPVLVAVFDLAELADKITNETDRRVLASDGLSITYCEGRGTSEAGAHPTFRGGSRQHHKHVCTEALNLLLHRFVSAFADGNHRDERCYPNEDPEHGKSRTQLVPPDCLRSGSKDHHRKAQKLAAGPSAPRSRPVE